MNRFRRRKEAKDSSEGTSNSSTESEILPFPAAIKVFRLGKKTLEPEPKAQIDLTSALPSSDNFRTSLLMNGLSARFSMLREQDDPNSRIGKASDDSVMYPTRNSRLGLCDHQSDLSDIMEVSSFSGACLGYSDIGRPNSNVSFSSYDKDTDFSTKQSIMNRSRPGEQNNLFGGRQKINVGNRTLYEADVRSTAYREERRRKMDLYKQEKNHLSNNYLTSTPESELSKENPSQDKPLLALKESSISPTSIINDEQSTPDEQSSKSFIHSTSPNFQLSKNRRLYESGSDDIHQERQSLVTNKIDIFAPKRSFMSTAPSPASSLNNSPVQIDRYDQQIIKSRVSNKVSSTTKASHIDVKKLGLISPPLSPPEARSPEEQELVTGTKIFESSKSSNHTSNQSEDEAKNIQILNQSDQNIETLNQSLPQEPIDRAGTDSQSRYVSKRIFSNYSAQATLLGQRKSGLLPDYRNQALPGPRNTLAPSPNSESPFRRTYFPSSSASQSRSYSDLRSSNHLEKNLKPSVTSTETSSLNKSMSQSHLNRPHAENRSSCSSSEASNATEMSSAGTGHETTPSSEIIGMVRKHMRLESDASSIYGTNSTEDNSNSTHSRTDTNSSSEYLTQSNPWEGDLHEIKTGLVKPNENDTIPPPPPKDNCSPFSNSNTENYNSFKKELDIQHSRHGSTDTQREQQILQDELASRRRYVQEKMRNFVESDKHPVNSMATDYSRYAPKNGTFGILRRKNSRGTIKIKEKENLSKNTKTITHSSFLLNHLPPSKDLYHEEDNEGDEPFTGRTKSFTPQINRLYSPRNNIHSERHTMLSPKHEKSEIKISDNRFCKG